ncbi:hypothetical protein Bbelb_187770 [Branchiostoma belcheri]|nr:hypothetical protein Bbelb_187770 [Branchiostoma belcheri]
MAQRAQAEKAEKVAAVEAARRVQADRVQLKRQARDLQAELDVIKNKMVDAEAQMRKFQMEMTQRHRPKLPKVNAEALEDPDSGHAGPPWVWRLRQSKPEALQLQKEADTPYKNNNNLCPKKPPKTIRDLLPTIPQPEGVGQARILWMKGVSFWTQKTGSWIRSSSVRLSPRARLKMKAQPLYQYQNVEEWRVMSVPSSRCVPPPPPGCPRGGVEGDVSAIEQMCATSTSGLSQSRQRTVNSSTEYYVTVTEYCRIPEPTVDRKAVGRQKRIANDHQLAKTWYCDGTFFVVLPPCSRSSCTRSSGKQVSLVFVLMSRREKADYTEVVDPRVENFGMDFEEGMRGAVRAVFPTLGLQSAYYEKAGAYTYELMRKLMVLHFLPAEHVRRAFEELRELTDNPMIRYTEILIPYMDTERSQLGLTADHPGLAIFDVFKAHRNLA